MSLEWQLLMNRDTTGWRIAMIEGCKNQDGCHNCKHGYCVCEYEMQDEYHCVRNMTRLPAMPACDIKGNVELSLREESTLRAHHRALGAWCREVDKLLRGTPRRVDYSGSWPNYVIGEEVC